MVRVGALNDDGTPYDPSIKEILRLVSGWFVKKDNKYHDVNNLQTSYQAQDLKQVIVSRIKVLFPNLQLTNKDLKDFFLCCLTRQLASQPRRKHPGMVWAHGVFASEHAKGDLQDGVATVNLWEYPAYRRGNGYPRDSV